MVVFVVTCLSTRANESGQLNHILFLLTSAFFITIALSLDFVFSEVLNKDHKKQNPMQVVKKVLMYSVKHKRPLRRSAFMFNPSFNPTRIDYAMSYFGGPFTFEQVENVKTFLNMLKIITVFGCFVFLQIGVSVCVFTFKHYINHYINLCTLIIVTSSPLRYVSAFSTLSTILMTPVHCSETMIAFQPSSSTGCSTLHSLSSLSLCLNGLSILCLQDEIASHPL